MDEDARVEKCEMLSMVMWLVADSLGAEVDFVVACQGLQTGALKPQTLIPQGSGGGSPRPRRGQGWLLWRTLLGSQTATLSGILMQSVCTGCPGASWCPTSSSYKDASRIGLEPP